MSDLLIYKICVIFSGVLISLMGYKLLMKGVFPDSESSELAANFGDNKILLKRASPGTFFALFGCLIISITVFKGFHMQNEGSIAASDSNQPTIFIGSSNMEQTIAPTGSYPGSNLGDIPIGDAGRSLIEDDFKDKDEEKPDIPIIKIDPESLPKPIIIGDPLLNKPDKD